MIIKFNIKIKILIILYHKLNPCNKLIRQIIWNKYIVKLTNYKIILVVNMNTHKDFLNKKKKIIKIRKMNSTKNYKKY